MPNTSRPFTCTMTSVSPVMLRDSALLAVCTGVTSAVIVTDSVTPPAVSVIRPSGRISPPSSENSAMVTGRNPSISTLTV